MANRHFKKILVCLWVPQSTISMPCSTKGDEQALCSNMLFCKKLNYIIYNFMMGITPVVEFFQFLQVCPSFFCHVCQRVTLCSNHQLPTSLRLMGSCRREPEERNVGFNCAHPNPDFILLLPVFAELLRSIAVFSQFLQLKTPNPPHPWATELCEPRSGSVWHSKPLLTFSGKGEFLSTLAGTSPSSPPSL